MNLRRIAVGAALLALCGGALAHGGASHGGAQASAVNTEQQAWGIAGSPRAVARVITVAMSDAMRFDPERIRVRRGETVRLVVRNDGKMLHEMVIGTSAALREHAELMERFPEMEHDAPWMVHVAPGASGEIVWTFNRPGRFEFACLIPGHYPAGMKGSIVVEGR